MTERQRRRYRIGTYWTNDFSGGCSGDKPLHHSDDLAEGFARAMVAHGHHWRVNHGSKRASPADFVSVPDRSGVVTDDDDDTGGVDTVEFAYLVTHGAISSVGGGRTKEAFIYRAGFGANASDHPEAAFGLTRRLVYPKCMWLNSHSTFGNKRLKWLVVDACDSMHFPGFVKSLAREADVQPSLLWKRTFHGLNMVFGFSGDSSDAWWIDDRGFQFGRRAGAGEPLADAWIDECYSWWLDDSPAALACGRTEEEALERLRNDSLSEPCERLPRGQIRWFAHMRRT